MTEHLEGGRERHRRARLIHGRNPDGTIPLPGGDVLTACEGCQHNPIRESWLRRCPTCQVRMCIPCYGEQAHRNGTPCAKCVAKPVAV